MTWEEAFRRFSNGEIRISTKTEEENREFISLLEGICLFRSGISPVRWVEKSAHQAPNSFRVTAEWALDSVN